MDKEPVLSQVLFLNPDKIEDSFKFRVPEGKDESMPFADFIDHVEKKIDFCMKFKDYFGNVPDTKGTVAEKLPLGPFYI